MFIRCMHAYATLAWVGNLWDLHLVYRAITYWSAFAQNLALMELKTALATLCVAFEFRLASELGGAQGMAHEETMALTLHTKHGIHLHCLPRHLRTLQLATSS